MAASHPAMHDQANEQQAQSTYVSSHSQFSVMLNLYPRISASSRDGDGDNDDVAGNRAFYGVAAVCVAICLFCVLVATVSVWKAFAFAAAVALLLVVLGFFAPRTTRVRRLTGGRPASPVLALTVTARGRPGAIGVPADVPPAFAYICPPEIGEKAMASCVLLCPAGVPGGRARRRDGAAAAVVQARLPRGVHRHVAAIAPDMPSLSVHGLAAADDGDMETLGLGAGREA